MYWINGHTCFGKYNYTKENQISDDERTLTHKWQFFSGFHLLLLKFQHGDHYISYRDFYLRTISHAGKLNYHSK